MGVAGSGFTKNLRVFAIGSFEFGMIANVPPISVKPKGAHAAILTQLPLDKVGDVDHPPLGTEFNKSGSRPTARVDCHRVFGFFLRAVNLPFSTVTCPKGTSNL